METVTILGKSPTGRLCLFDTDEVWGVNNVASQTELCPACGASGKVNELVCETCHGTGRVPQYPPKFTKLFAFDLLPKEYTDDMKTHAPICSWQTYADIPYPKDEVIKEFSLPGWENRYFTNTISYMIAYAAYLRVKVIKIYGVDVSFGAPYAQENRGVEYWIGRAQERGIQVIVPKESHLLRTVYGNLYGEINGCNMNLYLYERLNMINMLPRGGTYTDSLCAQCAWWVLFPKEDEAKAHGVQVVKNADGSLTFNAAQGEYASDVQMPMEVWDYCRNVLREVEAKGQLPYGALSLYEKMVLNYEDTGAPRDSLSLGARVLEYLKANPGPIKVR